MAVSSPIKRHGGKAYMAADIRKLFPKHARYVEPFFGSGAVMLAGDGEGVAEYANDLDGELVNFWKTLASPCCFADFVRQLQCTPFSKPTFEQMKNPFWPDSIQAATAFFVRNRQSRQALGRDFATPTSRLRRGMNEQVSAWLTAVDGLPEFHERLRRVEIWCEPAVEVIRKLDSPETLFYCDPPYVHETRSSTGEYKHEMTVEQHSELLTALSQIEGKFILSGYRCQLYDAAAAAYRWRCVDFDLPNNASSKASKERKIECCWMNY